MKRFFAVILTVALAATMLAVPVFAAGSSVLVTFPAQGSNASYSVWDFAKASNAQTAVSSPDVYQPLDDSALSASQGGLTIKSEASDSNNGVSIMDVPEGSFWAKIVYKFDSVSLTSDASGDIEGSASIISGSTIVDFAKFSVLNGEKAASVTNASGKSVEPGKFTSFVVKLDDVKDYMTVSPTYFDGALADSSFTIAYIAFFGTQEAAIAYDPSVESISVESVPAELDIFRHTATAQFIEGVTEEEMALSPESYMFELTNLGVSASAKSESAAVTKDSKGVTAVMHFDITAIDGTVNDWEITVVSPKSPATDQNGITPYAIIDSSNIDDIVVADGTFDKEVVSDGGTDVILLSNPSKPYFRFDIKKDNIKQMDAGTTWYIKTRFRFSEDTELAETEKQVIKYEYGNGWASLPGQFAKEYTFSTYTNTAKASSDLCVLFQGFTAANAKLYIEYIALFKDASDAADYGENVTYGGGEVNGIKPAYVINAKDAATGAFRAKESAKATVDTVMDGNKKVIRAKSINSTCNYVHFFESKSEVGAPMEIGNVYYIKMKYKFSSDAELAGSNSGVMLEYGDNDWKPESFADKFETAKTDWVYWTKKITITKTNTEFEMNIQSLKAGAYIYIDYIAFFTDEQAFNDYEQPASPKVMYNEKLLGIDRDSKTITLMEEPTKTADDIRASVFEIVNSDVFSFSGDWEETTEGKYLVMKKTLVDSTDSANTWTLVVKSRNQYEALDVIDFTDRASSESRIAAKSGNLTPDWHKIGNQDVFFFGGTLAEYWCSFKTNGVDMTKRPYVKIAYRLDENTEFASGKSGVIRVYGTSPKGYKTMVTIPNSLGREYSGHWNTVIYQLPNMASSSENFELETTDMNTLVSIKYIAFFETEADARNYTFGGADAQISSDGSTVTAAFDNIEDIGSASAYLVLYKDGRIADIKSSLSKDILTSDSLPAGTYTAKAFLIHNLTLKPMMNAVSETIKIE